MIISEYRADKRYSQSDVKQFLKLTPERFIYQYRNKKPPTESMIFGAALHNYILEPESFEEFYFIDPWRDRRAGKVYQDHAKLMAEEAGDRTILKLGGSDCTDKGFNSILSISDWIQGGSLAKTVNHPQNVPEHSLYGNINGVDVKGQLDIWREGVGIIDLKFTEYPIDTDHMLNKISVDGRFDLQAFFYIELVKQNYGITVPMIFRVISWKEKPILTRAVEISYAKTPELLENARMQVETSLFEMKQYRDVTEWEPDRNIYIPTFPQYLYGDK